MEEEVVAVEESHSCADGLEKTRGITEWTGASAAPVSLLLLPQRTPAPGGAHGDRLHWSPAHDCTQTCLTATIKDAVGATEIR